MENLDIFSKFLHFVLLLYTLQSTDLSNKVEPFENHSRENLKVSLVTNDTIHVSNDHLIIQTGSQTFPYGDFETAVDHANDGDCINFLIDHDLTYPIVGPVVITKRITFTNRGHRIGILLPILGPREVTIE